MKTNEEINAEFISDYKRIIRENVELKEMLNEMIIERRSRLKDSILSNITNIILLLILAVQLFVNR